MSSRPLRDGSALYNSLSSKRRKSLGSGMKVESDSSPQKDQRSLLDSYCSRENLLTASREPAKSGARRQSFGGDAFRGETPIRDRRAMLEAWRQARAEKSHDNLDTKKRSRADPPLPPTNGFTPKHRKFHRTQDSSQESGVLSQLSTGTDQTLHHYDDEAENQSRGSSLVISRTPINRWGHLGSARRHSLLGRNIGQATGKFSVCRSSSWPASFLLFALIFPSLHS